MTSYSAVTDLLIGDLPLPSYISAQKFCDDATDQIDSVIGNRYETPLDLSDSSDIVRPARLLIKRINNLLASGRLLLALDQSGEQTTEHAYGLSLLRQAESALAAIATGSVTLPGADVAEHFVPGNVAQMSVQNVDQVSAVEAFYQQVVDRSPYDRTLPTDRPAWYPGNDNDTYYANRG